jgi:RNA polymerase-binding transcription factor DksA
MKPVDKDRYRRALESLRERMRPDANAINEQTRSSVGGEGAQELSNAPFHLGDRGTDEFLFDMNTVLLENEEYLVNEVRSALTRLQQGSYGVCEQCGKAIAKERLQAIPYARHCVGCADAAGSGRNANYNVGRPSSPRDTLAPEGDMSEYRGMDREAAFTDLEVERDRTRSRNDQHAAGTPGGGGAHGGLAGSNGGSGDPNISELEDEMGSGFSGVEDARDDDRDEPKSGRSGGAVGGTPAGKRARS